MTLPNKLTLFRIILIPAMVIVAYIPVLNDGSVMIGQMTLANFINVIIFIVASSTDFLDGYIARKYNLVTTFGKFADPLADKLLVISAMVVLCTQIQQYAPQYSWFIPGWVIIVILCREFIVSGIRLVAVERGNVIAAGLMGKIKTFTTMVALIVLFFYQIEFNQVPVFGYIGAGLMYVALLFTILSGAEYFWKNRKVILESI
jgi:CDP-diacylglycerol--glycerol-3-phosphate 3-phosphatidyltransferase